MEIPEFQCFDFLPTAPVVTVSAAEEEKNEVVVEDRMTDEEIQLEADEIAMKIMEFLIESFKKKESRDPTEEEIEQLRDEMTAERIAQLLSNEGEGDEEDEEEDEEEEEEEEADEEDEENKGDDAVETTIEDDDTKKRSNDCADEINPEKRVKNDITAQNDENIVVN